MIDSADRDALEARLDELEHESQARRAELRALAAALPEATSRRTYLRQLVSGIVHAPDRGLVAKRTVLKILRTPTDLVRRAR